MKLKTLIKLYRAFRTFSNRGRTGRFRKFLLKKKKMK